MTDDRPAFNATVSLERTFSLASEEEIDEFLADLREEYDDEEITLSLSVESSDPSELASLSLPPTSSAEATDTEEDVSPTGEQDTREDGQAAPSQSKESGLSLGAFEVGDRVRDLAADSRGIGTVAKVNEQYGTAVVEFDNGRRSGRDPSDITRLDMDGRNENDSERVAAESADPETEDSDSAETEEEGRGDIPFPLSPGTRKYQVLSTLSALTRDGEAATTRQIVDAVEGTEWEMPDMSGASVSLIHLRENGAVERVGTTGHQSYLYDMTLTGEGAVAALESEGGTTFEDIRPDDESTEETDTDTAEDAVEDTEADTADDPEDLDADAAETDTGPTEDDDEEGPAGLDALLGDGDGEEDPEKLNQFDYEDSLDRAIESSED